MRFLVGGLLARDVEKGSKQSHDTSNPPVTGFPITSPWTSPFLISKVEVSVLSQVAPPKPLTYPLVSNEATASSVEPNNRKLFSFVGSPLVSPFTAVQRMICLAPQDCSLEEFCLQ